LSTLHRNSENARQRANAKKKPQDRHYLPYTEVKRTQLNLLLDSGCIGRDFITKSTVERLKLNTSDILFPIDVNSIHGSEIATKVVTLVNMPIIYGETRLIIPEVNLVVIEKAPAEIILGHLTLRDHGVYERCSYFGSGLDGASGAVKGSAHYPQSDVSHSNTPFNALTSERLYQPDDRYNNSNTKYKTIHISDILRYESDEQSTEELLPEDIFSTYWQNPQRDEQFQFKVKGSEADRRKLLELLNQNRDVFSTTLSTQPAKLTPMKIDVDYEGFKADKRSREPTRAQTAERKIAIAQWIRQAVADAVIKPSSAEAWSQLMLTKKPNGKWRFAIDYRALNKYTKAVRSPIPI
jgi:hypothetical protein